MDINKICLGIDFGTTNSCISFWYNNCPVIIKDIEDSDTIPTVIEILDNKKIIGHEAYKRKEIFEKIIYNNFVIYEIKKLIGKRYSDLDKKYINLLGYTIESDENDNILIVNNDKKYRIEEIITHIFMSFYYLSNVYLQKNYEILEDVKNVIISVPALFNDNQRELIKQCAINSGFNVIRLINEPTAASLCYGITNIQTKEEMVIVFDLGGGTLDISLLKIYKNDYEVIGSSGNSNLGGSDFDRKIMEYCITMFIDEYKIESDLFLNNVSEQNIQKLKYLTEKTKIALSDNLKTKIIIDDFYEDKQLNIIITREIFNTICKDLISLIIKPLNELLNICEIKKNEIDQIIMVGGMTKVPIIINNVELFFGKDVNCSIDPNTVVSIGASRYGYSILNEKDVEDRLLLIDRTSLSLGLELSGGIMDVFIKRGSIIPVKKIKKYTTDKDYMEEIDIKIFEGERKFTKDNIFLGDFKLTGIEKKKRGMPEIQITYAIDHNGIINVKAEDLNNTLNKKSIRVIGNKKNLNENELNIVIENAKLMDKNDRIDKEKKQSYNNIIYEITKILDNINNEEFKLCDEKKSLILVSIHEIQEWITSKKYDEIEIEKYRELRNDFKNNYSIFLIHSDEKIKEMKTSNEFNDNTHILNNKNDGVKIIEDEENVKKYELQLNYMKSILEEYTQITMHLKELCVEEFNLNNKKFKKFLINDECIEIIKETIQDHENNVLNEEFIDKPTLFNNLNEKCFNVKILCNDFITNFLVNNDLTPEDINNFCLSLYEEDITYKNLYSQFENFIEFEPIFNKLLSYRENVYLNNNNNEKLDNLLLILNLI